MFSMFYTKAGDTPQKERIYDRPLVLVASKKAYNHFVDYTTEANRMAILAEKEAKRLGEAKKATCEMSKTWNNTVKNMQRQRKEELFARSKKEEEERIQFMKNMTEKKEAEHAEIIKEARKLLFYRKPQCRLINRALLTSECLRELDAQLQFQKTLKGIDKEQNIKYAELIKKDVEKHEEEELKKAEKQAIKKKKYTEELKKQIQGNTSNLKREEMKEKEAEKEDLRNMSKELELMKKCEIEEAEKRKKQLKELFLNALETKKKQDLKVKQDEKFQEQAMAVYNKAKRQIEKKLASQIKKEKEEKIRRSEYLAKKCAVITKSDAGKEELRLKKALEEKEAAENEKKETRKRYEEKLRAEMEKYRQELALLHEKQKKDEEDFKAWETLQRSKRDEYNKEIAARNFEIERLKKQKFSESLRRQIALKEAEKKRLESLDVEEYKTTIEKTNEKILRYGEEVLKESEGVRPLFPIIKVIEQFKKEVGLVPQKISTEPIIPSKKRRQKQQPICQKSIPETQICYV